MVQIRMCGLVISFGTYCTNSYLLHRPFANISEHTSFTHQSHTSFINFSIISTYTPSPFTPFVWERIFIGSIQEAPHLSHLSEWFPTSHKASQLLSHIQCQSRFASVAASDSHGSSSVTGVGATMMNVTSTDCDAYEYKFKLEIVARVNARITPTWVRLITYS